MSSPFAAPAAPGTGIKWQEVNSALLLIEPKSVEENIKTDYGTTDAVLADIVVLDGDQAGEEYPDCLIFPKVLQGQLKRQLGQKVLGRVTQGVGKPGQSPPWMLAEATAQDQQVGISYLNQQPQVSQPAPAQQQTQQASQQWQQQNQPQQQWNGQQPSQQQGGNDVPFA